MMKAKATKSVASLMNELTELAFGIRSIAVATAMAAHYDDDRDKSVVVPEFYRLGSCDVSNLLQAIHEKADKVAYYAEMIENLPDGVLKMECELW